MLNCRGKQLPLGERTLIMGILNVTPDSFYDGGRYLDVDKACTQARELVDAGADIIDIGGESTRPGAGEIDPETELNRVLPVVERLLKDLSVPISIDTTKAEVARKVLDCGAGMVNDISALRNDPDMVEVVAEYGVPVVLMHMKGKPRDMQVNPHYQDVIYEIKSFLRERIDWAVAHGVRKDNIIIDPGIGFGKLLEHNLEILRNLCEFKELGRPILVGPSRKSFIGGILDQVPEHRLWGTAAAVSVAIINGAHMIRVHDVGEMHQVAKVIDAIVKNNQKPAPIRLGGHRG